MDPVMFQVASGVVAVFLLAVIVMRRRSKANN